MIPIVISALFSLLAYRNVRHIIGRQTPVFRRRLDRQLTAMILLRGSVINALINSNKWTVRGLSRNISSEGSQKLIANGVQIISCNIDCFDECVEAFKDAYGVFAMTNYWECGMTKEYEQGMNMVNAAKQQGVRHFIWSSLPDTKAISTVSHNVSQKSLLYRFANKVVRAADKDLNIIQSTFSLLIDQISALL
ncbi:unnamed protein product [Rotaria socialis]